MTFVLERPVFEHTWCFKVHQVVKKDEVSYPLSKVSTDGVTNEPIPRKAVKHSNGRDRPLANTSMVLAFATTVSSIQKTTPKTILDDPALRRSGQSLDSVVFPFSIKDS